MQQHLGVGARARRRVFLLPRGLGIFISLHFMCCRARLHPMACSSLRCALGRVRREGRGADYSLRCGAATVRVHSQILAARCSWIVVGVDGSGNRPEPKGQTGDFDPNPKPKPITEIRDCG